MPQRSHCPKMRPAHLLSLFLLLLLPLGCSLIGVNRYVTSRKYDDLGLRSGKMELKSGTMRYRLGGEGFPVMLVHGFGFGALETWANQVGPLAKSYRVLAPDLYWLGHSKAKEPMDTAEAQAGALAELLDKLGIKKAHVVGLSFGGYVAIAFARRYPERVGKLVLVDAAGLKPTAEEEKIIAKNFRTADIRQVLVPPDTKGLKHVLNQLFYKDRWIPEFILEEVLKDEMWRSAPAKRAMLIKMTSPGGMLEPAQIAEIKKRTLLLWGRHDPLILPSMAERIRGALPDARIVYFEKSAHSPMLEESKAFNRALIGFLNSTP